MPGIAHLAAFRRLASRPGAVAAMAAPTAAPDRRSYNGGEEEPP